MGKKENNSENGLTDMKTEYIECACHSPEHVLRFVTDNDEDYPAVYVYVFLQKQPFFKRLVSAFKYVFGHTCKYGHFDESVIEPEECDKLIKILTNFRKKNK